MCISCFGCYNDTHPKTKEHRETIDRVLHLWHQLETESLCAAEGEELRKLVYNLQGLRLEHRMHYHPDEKWLVTAIQEHKRGWHESP